MSDYLDFTIGDGRLVAPDWKGVASLFSKITAVMASVGALDESGQTVGQRDGYTYSDINDIVVPVRKAMAKVGLASAMQVTRAEQKPDDKALHTNMSSTFILGDTDSGSFMTLAWESEAADYAMKDKGINKSATAAQKYFLKRMFMLYSKDDNDDYDERADDADKSNTAPQRVDVSPVIAEAAPIARALNELFGLNITPKDAVEGAFDTTIELIGGVPEGLKGRLALWYMDQALVALAKQHDKGYSRSEVLAYIASKVPNQSLSSLPARYAAMKEWFEKEG